MSRWGWEAGEPQEQLFSYMAAAPWEAGQQEGSHGRGYGGKEDKLDSLLAPVLFCLLKSLLFLSYIPLLFLPSSYTQFQNLQFCSVQVQFHEKLACSMYTAQLIWTLLHVPFVCDYIPVFINYFNHLTWLILVSWTFHDVWIYRSCKQENKKVLLIHRRPYSLTTKISQVPKSTNIFTLIQNEMLKIFSNTWEKLYCTWVIYHVWNIYTFGDQIIEFGTCWKGLRVLKIHIESWERKQSQIPHGLLCWCCLGLARRVPIRPGLLGLPFRDPFITLLDCSLRLSPGWPGWLHRQYCVKFYPLKIDSAKNLNFSGILVSLW